MLTYYILNIINNITYQSKLNLIFITCFLNYIINLTITYKYHSKYTLY